MILHSNSKEGEAAPSQPVHPRGSSARVLLTSVFGPYARDDEYGSRVLNPMELYHNQVTRVQGAFSLRMFHRSWGLMLIQANIRARCALLDFPDRDRFIREIRDGDYDVVGISAIMPNIGKVRAMCALIREHLPSAVIVVGGHIANVPDLAGRVDADHVVRGEGVRWMRRFLGENPDTPINHPLIPSAFGTRSAGVEVSDGDWAPALIPTVGCPKGCNFCSTSAMFGGKGKCVHFYETGDELFDIMCRIEEAMGTTSFFVMDENFLLHRRRALRLLALMQENDKAWSLYVFSSADVLRMYTVDQLVRLGISWVWIGLEGEDSRYSKLDGIDAFALVNRLQSHGIRVLGSTIIGLENHTPENMDRVIDYAVRYDTDFHQFMLYTPAAGTPLHTELTAEGVMKNEDEYDHADIHGQLIFNYRHPHITEGREAEYILKAFTRDFEVNGPSTVRVVRTTLAGWTRHKNNPDPCIRQRYRKEAAPLATTYSALVGAARRYYRTNPTIRRKLTALLRELHREFGLRSRIFSALGGLWLHRKIRREERRLAAGHTYEPPTFFEKNFHDEKQDGAAPCRFVQPDPAYAVRPAPDNSGTEQPREQPAMSTCG